MIGKSQLDLGDTAPEFGGATIEEAKRRGIDEVSLGMMMLEHPTDISLDIEGSAERVTFIPGHFLGSNVKGPLTRSDVMVIGKMPGRDDSAWRKLFTGQSGKLWTEMLRDHGIDCSNWYATNACRFFPPNKIKTVKASWLSECRWLLHQEMHIVQPKYILLFGVDALKMLFGNKYTLSKVRGANDLWYGKSKCVVTIHPAAVLQEPVNYPGFKKDIISFGNLTIGKETPTISKSYLTVTNQKELQRVIDLALKENVTRFAVDTEWGGLDGCEYPKGQLRCIQFSHKPGMSVCVVLRKEGLEPAFAPNIQTAIDMLNKLFKRPGVEVAGHNLRSDLKFLVKEGLDITDEFMRGFDTMLAHHLLYPTELQGLENLSIKFTDLGRYDRSVADWLSENKYNKEVMAKYGYANIPGPILYPYACADTDVVIRCWHSLESALKDHKLGPMFGPYKIGNIPINNMYDFYRKFVHAVHLPLQEIETTGIMVDKDRLQSLSKLFSAKRDELITAFRAEIKWSDFNFRSVDHVRELLFGEQKDKGKLRPDGAVCLNVTPLKTTGKPAKDWDKLSDKEKETNSPSTDSESLQILAADNELARKLLELRFVDQILKNFLKGKAVADDKDENDEKEPEYISGLIGCIDDDSCIRTSISQLTDTGRYRSSRPNLQNLPKKQEASLRKLFSPNPEELVKVDGWAGIDGDILKQKGLLHPDYFSLRSCFMARPGHVFVEADYVSAELFVLAYISKDAELISILKDKTRDIHSEQAVKGFNLDCSPKEVKKKYPNFRTSAKNVIYGIIYGRGAAALVRESKKANIPLTEEQAQNQIDTFFASFPGVKEYMNKCKKAVYDPGYVETPFGRRRWFYPTSDYSMKGAQERQAINMPIQGTVAEALSLALTNLYYYRQLEPNLEYKIILPIHDAIMLEVPERCVERVKDHVLPMCMSRMVPIPHLNFKLEIDVSVATRWSEDKED